MLVYVDDVVLTGSDDKYVQSIVKKIIEEFAIRELGDLCYLMGMQVKRNKDEIIYTRNSIL